MQDEHTVQRHRAIFRQSSRARRCIPLQTTVVLSSTTAVTEANLMTLLHGINLCAAFELLVVLKSSICWDFPVRLSIEKLPIRPSPCGTKFTSSVACGPGTVFVHPSRTVLGENTLHPSCFVLDLFLSLRRESLKPLQLRPSRPVVNPFPCSLRLTWKNQVYSIHLLLDWANYFHPSRTVLDHLYSNRQAAPSMSKIHEDRTELSLRHSQNSVRTCLGILHCIHFLLVHTLAK